MDIKIWAIHVVSKPTSVKKPSKHTNYKDPQFSEIFPNKNDISMFFLTHQTFLCKINLKCTDKKINNVNTEKTVNVWHKIMLNF